MTLCWRCHKLDTSQRTNAVCKKGEPDRLLPIGIIYYTASVLICKYSIVTKIGKKICEKTYELEFLRILRALFCELFPWTFLSWFF